jgi:hypothetical protein
MTYTRKTKDWYIIMGAYFWWEKEEIDRFETKKEAREMLTKYRMSHTKYRMSHTNFDLWIIKKRIKID